MTTPVGPPGKLRIYLGAAAGVGKTYKMLEEGNRRLARGTDVVIGLVETHDRQGTAAQIRDLPVVPRRVLPYRGSALEEMDVDAILARRPAVALVDEMAHTNVPGSRNAKRSQDVQELLEAGIDVISTLNIQHLASLNDVVEQITGIKQQETIADAMVRAAQQIELVDMTPEALRRRMAHGNIYPAVAIDTALANYFRPGNLGALRELALLWLADRVDENLAEYRVKHGIRQPWETKERVLVALSGDASGETLIRRGARMAARAHGDLLAVHVRTADGTVQPDATALEGQRALLAEMGGSYTEVTSGDVPNALINFAVAEAATQLLLASSRHSWLYHTTHGSVTTQVIRLAGPIDVHVISTAEQATKALPRAVPPSQPVPIPLRRRQLGWLLGIIGVVLVAAALAPLRAGLGVPGVLLCLLLAVVAVAFIGGLRPAAAATVVAALSADYFFLPPIHSLDIARPVNIVAVVVFFVAAGIVSHLIDRLTRRGLQVARAHAEAEALARLAGSSVVAEAATLPSLVAEIRRTFDLDGAAILVRDGAKWLPMAEAGSPAPVRPEDAEFSAELDQGTVLTLTGRSLGGTDIWLLGPFVTQLRLAQERIRLRGVASAAKELAETDTARTALLEAVSHDLRTPLTSIKAAVTSLEGSDTTWSPAKTQEFYRTIDSETDRLTALVSNLLDITRLRAGALPLVRRQADLEQILYDAVNSLSSAGSAVVIDLPDKPPEVWADPGLLERAVANVMANAQAASPPGLVVRVQAEAVGDQVQIRVIDQGPGISAEQRQHMFQPFQRRGDGGGGLGLGLAIAKGFTEAMDGELTVEDTPGGGATFVFFLPRFAPDAGAEEGKAPDAGAGEGKAPDARPEEGNALAGANESAPPADSAATASTGVAPAHGPHAPGIVNRAVRVLRG
jgi:two-component system, OmpR family, sensor histidine kinase KdpD